MLTSSFAGGASLAGFHTGELQAASYYRPIRYAYDRGFNRWQAGLIVQALNKVAVRFLDPRMFWNAKRNYRRWYMGGNVGFYNTSHFESWFYVLL